MDVLADEPGVVECDLAGMAAEGSAVPEAFASVGHYLTRWPGTVVMVRAPDSFLRASLGSAAYSDRLLFQPTTGRTAPPETSRRLLPPLERKRLALSSLPTAPREARSFVESALELWEMPRLVAPASQVVSELVTTALADSSTAIDLILSRVDDRIRIAVRSYGRVPSPAPFSDLPQSPLSGRGLQLVQAFADGWGVIPAGDGGETVWAVLDAASVRKAESHRVRIRGITWRLPHRQPRTGPPGRTTPHPSSRRPASP